MWTGCQRIKVTSARLRAGWFSTTATRSMPGFPPPAPNRKYSRASPSSELEVVTTSSLSLSSSTASRASSSASENWPTQQTSLQPRRTASSAKLKDDSTSEAMKAGSNNAQFLTLMPFSIRLKDSKSHRKTLRYPKFIIMIRASAGEAKEDSCTFQYYL